MEQRFQAFMNNRWLVLVAAIWIQSCNASRKIISWDGVAKDVGVSVGFLAAFLCEILPSWCSLLLGALHNFIGYVRTSDVQSCISMQMCVLICVGNNGDTYIITAINFPDQASLIFMLAVGPTMVVFALMFIIRPVEGDRQVLPSDGSRFAVIYSVCFLIAPYLMAITHLEGLVTVSHNLVTVFTVVLFLLLFIPIIVTFREEPSGPAREVLLLKTEQREAGARQHEVVCSEVEDDKSKEVDLLLPRGPRIGEDFTLMQALITAELWLIMLSLLLGTGSGYDNAHIFVPMIGISSFFGRVGGVSSRRLLRDFNLILVLISL
ncbi:hypothetical protein GQ457_06G040760 [Hibiscus cannabinus]